MALASQVRPAPAAKVRPAPTAQDLDGIKEQLSQGFAMHNELLGFTTSSMTAFRQGMGRESKTYHRKFAQCWFFVWCSRFLMSFHCLFHFLCQKQHREPHVLYLVLVK
jgi:hypothetical protein